MCVILRQDVCYELPIQIQIRVQNRVRRGATKFGHVGVCIELTHGHLVARYGDIDMVNYGSGNGLFSDDSMSLPDPMLTDRKWSSVSITQTNFAETAEDINS